MQVTIEEIAMLIGQKDIELLHLQKQLQAALKQLGELKDKYEPQPKVSESQAQ